MYIFTLQQLIAFASMWGVIGLTTGALLAAYWARDMARLTLEEAADDD